jgi:iron complex transport system ATP-binding protein
LLHNVSARFEEGKLHLIIGPNGAGKSTFIRLLSRQTTPESGDIFYNNTNINHYTEQQLSRFRAVLSQNNELAFPLSVWEVVMMGRYPHFISQAAAKDEKACEEAMKLFEVWDLSGRNYLTLSGGEKQRVQFARVMAQIWTPEKDRHPCLVLDEPLTFLDVHYQYEFMNILAERVKTQGLLVIGVLHDLNLAARFADQLILINRGEIMAAGTVEEVFTKENIKTAFGIEPVIMQVPHYNKPYLFF